MARLVAGISPDHDTQAIEDALKAHDVDLTKVKIFTKTPNAAHPDSALDFVDVIVDMEDNSLSDDMTKNTGSIDGGTGTGVPGITSGRSMTVSSFAEAEASPDYLAGVAIPDDEVDNFNEAIDEGRAVATYEGDDTGAAETAFKAAGLRNVRAF